MKVILQRDIPKTGKTGEVVTVKDGYARNYLFPRAYAVAATGGALKEHAARQDREKARSAGLLASAQADAEKLTAKPLILLGKVGTGTKLYGSVTASDLAEQITREYGVTVDKRRIGLLDPIKNLGEYRVPVRLHLDVTVPLVVEVITEQEQERRKNLPPPVVAEAAPEETAAPETAVAEPTAVTAAAETTETEAPAEAAE